MKNLKKFLLGISLLAILVFGVTSLPGIKVSVSPTEIFGATNAIPTPIALFQTSLQSGITSTATSMTLVSGVDKDGNNLSGINRFSTLAYQRLLDAKDMESGVAVISSVEPDRVNAVASYLSAFVRK